jgi:hypothetical protein
MLPTPGLVLRAEVPPGAIYEAGGPIPIRCTIRNDTPRSSTVRLPNLDTGAPGFFLARVRSIDGKVFTAHDADFDGWWTRHVLDSSFYQERPGDRLTVPLLGESRFDVDLAAILGGHRTLKAGLPAGRYLVELRSEAGDSEPIAISIGAPADQIRRRREPEDRK